MTSNLIVLVESDTKDEILTDSKQFFKKQI